MKRVIKKAIMLSACLLTASVMWATVIGGGTATGTTATNPDSVAGCGDKSPELKKLNCIAKDGGPAYGCKTTGDLEACTVVASCP